MHNPSPQFFVYDAERSVMVPRRKGLADRTYVDGQEYRLGEIEGRSSNSHRHFFAAIHEAWSNLLDDIAARFPTEDHLRKWALIKAGYYTNTDFVCGSHAEALRLVAALKTVDDYSVTVVKGSVVSRLVAKSQSARAMGAADFQASKTAVLEIVSALIGTNAAELSREAGRAA